MECIYETEEDKYGEICLKGHKFCMEERCPDFCPKHYNNEGDYDN